MGRKVKIEVKGLDGIWDNINPRETINLKELNDGAFGIPEPHTDIHHPDYFQAKAEIEQWEPKE